MNERTMEVGDQEGQRHEKLENFSSKIVLQFMRHDEKEKSQPGVPDEEVRLTQKGKLHAMEKAKLSDISQAVAFGSPRKRTQETAGLVMAGGMDTLTGTESLEELKKLLDDGRTYGSKIGTDARLNFEVDENSEYGKRALDEFKAGKLLSFLVHESDALAEKYGEENAFTYNSASSNIAKIIQKYLTIAPRFDELVNDPQKSYKNVMERFLGSHQTVLESFLAKVVEKMKGDDTRDVFVESVSGKGFDFAESFNAEIIVPDVGGEPELRISYSNSAFSFDEVVSSDVIDEIADKK